VVEQLADRDRAAVRDELEHDRRDERFRNAGDSEAIGRRHRGPGPPARETGRGAPDSQRCSEDREGAGSSIPDELTHDLSKRGLVAHEGRSGICSVETAGADVSSAAPIVPATRSILARNMSASFGSG
jgi:hypothetical protein